MSNFFDAAGIDLGIVVLILIILVLVLMLITLNLSLGLHRLRVKYKIFMRGKDAQSLERLFNSKFREIDRLVTISDVQMSDIKALKANYNKALTKYGIVKYDAFDNFLYIKKTILPAVNGIQYKSCIILIQHGQYKT